MIFAGIKIAWSKGDKDMFRMRRKRMKAAITAAVMSLTAVMSALTPEAVLAKQSDSVQGVSIS